MICSWHAVPALWLSAFTGSPAKSYMAVSEASVLWLRKCYYTPYTRPEIFHVVILLTPLLHPCHGGNLEVTQTQENLTYHTAERSPLSSSASIPKLTERLKSNTRKVLLGLKWSHDLKLRLSDGTKVHVRA